MNLIYIFFYLLLGISSNDNTANLTIKVENIKHMEGNIEIAIFHTGERFLEKGQAYKNYKVKVTDKSETILIKDLSKGEYAVSMYHDRNSDGICNRNFFGIPKEPYAFSNNIRPKFSAPSFEDCKFNLSQDHELVIKLIH